MLLREPVRRAECQAPTCCVGQLLGGGTSSLCGQALQEILIQAKEPSEAQSFKAGQSRRTSYLRWERRDGFPIATGKPLAAGGLQTQPPQCPSLDAEGTPPIKGGRHSPSVLACWAVVTKCHRPGGLDNRNSLSDSSGGWNSKVEGLSVLFPRIW